MMISHHGFHTFPLFVDAACHRSSSCLSFLREPRQRSPSLLYRATQPMFPLHSPCFFLADLVSATQALSLCCCLGIDLSHSIYAQLVFSSPLKPNLFL
ncbi:unnamed protein product [Prunus armeniaca]